jgi:hypothetical protein
MYLSTFVWTYIEATVLTSHNQNDRGSFAYTYLSCLVAGLPILSLCLFVFSLILQFLRASGRNLKAFCSWFW